MKYFIAYVIKGEARDYHIKLGDSIAQQFNYKPLSLKVPPHLTLKAPFETDNDIQAVESLLAKFVIGKQAPKLLLEGFGLFRNEVVFIDVKPSKDAVEMISKLHSEIKKITWIPFDAFETQDGGAHLHATLAFADTKENFVNINNYLPTDKPKFEIVLDNITLLKREPERWVVHKEYSLLSP
jgi:2'-5' RNA ligase